MKQRRSRAKSRKNRKSSVRWFRVAALLLGAAALSLSVILPSLSVIGEMERASIQEASDAYWRAQNENNRLRQELRESGTPDYIKETARRKYGYSVYGETIYVVENLDELIDDVHFEVYGGDSGSETGE